MPTGYTHKIKDGITFDEFVMGCARAFGACVTMRDDSSDKEIPEKFEPSDYHVNAIKKLNDRLECLSKMFVSDCGFSATECYNDEVKRRYRATSEAIDLEIKYRKMLSYVSGWEPPSYDHEELKKFMIEQIKSSIDWDCNLGDYYRDKTVSKLAGEEWFDFEVCDIIKDIEYHQKEYAKEVDRTNNRNEWISKLRNSLK